MKQTEEFNEILNITSRLLKVNKRELISKDRSMHLAIPRAVAAVVGMKDAMIKKDIVAKSINRHRTATYHYLKKHNDFFKWHAPYRNGYIKVLKEYKKIDENKKQFIDKHEFDIFIQKLKINNSIRPDIIIDLSSNDYKHTFLSDCFSFTEHMKKINKNLEGYKYNLTYKTYEG
tara:strand:- start:293 stop:814 length:522 start_codon:yes stop_codon:yes gene_type:complete